MTLTALASNCYFKKSAASSSTDFEFATAIIEATETTADTSTEPLLISWTTT
jgi:hypothetical protein